VTEVGLRILGSAEEAIATARRYADEIAAGAADRDRQRRLPVVELEELGRSGLLALSVPPAYGGLGATKETIVEVFRIISVADPAIGQIPQNHYQFVDAVIRYGSDAQRALFLEAVLRGDRFGNAVAERGGKTAWDQRTVLQEGTNGLYRLNGRKYYSTGAMTAQWIPVVAQDENETRVFVYVPRDADGVTVEHDWTAFGQRATISGTTTLDDVVIRPEWVITPPVRGDEPDTFGAFGQVLHAAVDVGIARGALQDAVHFLRTRSRPASNADVDRAADEPHVILRFGEFQTRLHAAEALLARAGLLLDAADAHSTKEQITSARLAVAEAKAYGGEVALHIASDSLELLGTSATDEEYGLDRHWRNARTHTLHDANRWKYVHVGNYLINGVAPAADNIAI
jgi:SfnB family sulfur acquisition oxidoreductase